MYAKPVKFSFFTFLGRKECSIVELFIFAYVLFLNLSYGVLFLNLSYGVLFLNLSYDVLP